MVREPMVMSLMVMEPLVMDPMVMPLMVREPLVMDPMVMSLMVREPLVMDPMVIMMAKVKRTLVILLRRTCTGQCTTQMAGNGTQPNLIAISGGKTGTQHGQEPMTTHGLGLTGTVTPISTGETSMSQACTSEHLQPFGLISTLSLSR